MAEARFCKGSYRTCRPDILLTSKLEATRLGTDHRTLKAAIEAVNHGSEALAARRMNRAVATAFTGRSVDEVASR